MNDTNQLPEPELGYIQTDKSNQPAFSARQMRELMAHALQARAILTLRPEKVPMTGEQRQSAFLSFFLPLPAVEATAQRSCLEYSLPKPTTASLPRPRREWSDER